MTTVTDYLQQNIGGVTNVVSGSWVRLTNNATAATYISTAATDANGLYTVNSVPAGTYTVATGPTNTGAWTNTGDAAYTVGGAPQFVFATPANPATFTSLTFVQMGFGGVTSITPQFSGRVLVLVSGSVSNNTASDGVDFAISYGTGGAPVFGAAATGTTIIPNSGSWRWLNNASTAAVQTLFNLSGAASVLVIGTTYWLDLQCRAVTAGTGQITNITITVIEF